MLQVLPYNHLALVNNNQLTSNNPISFGYKSHLKEEAQHCAYCASEIATGKNLNKLSEKILTSKGDELSNLFTKLVKNFSLQSEMSTSHTTKERIHYVKNLKSMSEKMPEDSGRNLIAKFTKSHNHLRKGLYDEYFLKQIYRKPETVARYLVNPFLTSVDHIIPKSKGGENVNENYMVSCVSCNRSRNNEDFKSWSSKHTVIFKNIVNYLKEIISNNKPHKRDNYVNSIIKLISENTGKTLHLLG